MNTQEKIKKLFEDVVNQYGGNQKAAAEHLGVNTVTFWGWVNGKRGLNKALCDAIDRAGGVLIIPGDTNNESPLLSAKNNELINENKKLEIEKGNLEISVKTLQELIRQLVEPRNQSTPTVPHTSGASGKEQLSLISEQEKNCKAG